MEEKLSLSSVNFEIAKELHRNNKAAIRKLIKPFDNNQPPPFFDATQQNVQVATFMVTLDPRRFLEEIDRNKVSVKEIVSSIDKSKLQPQNAARYYLVYNWLFFSKYLNVNIRLVETLHFNFRLALNSVTLPPTFPILKYFLSKMNHLFNLSNKLRFFEHIEEIHRLIEYASDYKALKSRPSVEPKFKNSCIYGCKVSSLTDLDQRNFCSEEVEVSGLILQALSQLLGMNPLGLAQSISDIKTKLEALQSDKKDKHTSDKKVVLEETVKLKLCKHIEAALCFLSLLDQLKAERQLGIDQIVSANTFLKDNRLIEKYFFAVANLLSLANFKRNNFTVCSLQLSRLANTCITLSKTPSEKLDRFDGLSKFNNPFFRVPLLFNCFISNFSLSNFRSVASLGELLVVSFTNCPKFWFFYGVSFFKLWLEESEAVVRKERTDTAKTLRESAKILEKRRIDLVVAPLINLDRVVHGHCVSSLSNLENETSSKRLLSAIRCMENSLKLIQNLTSKDYLSSILQSTGQRYKDYFNGVKTVLANDPNRLLVPVLEHLTYLYLMANKPMQALKTISIASLQTSLLSHAQHCKFASYHLKAALLLKKQSVMKSAIGETDSCLKVVGQTTVTVRSFSDTGDNSLPAAFLLKYNTLSFLTKDKEGARQAVHGMVEDFLGLPDKQRTACESYLRNALFNFFSIHEFSQESLMYVAGNKFDVSKFIFSKNGKWSPSV